jgi:hypothetical protein
MQWKLGEVTGNEETKMYETRVRNKEKYKVYVKKTYDNNDYVFAEILLSARCKQLKNKDTKEMNVKRNRNVFITN